MTTKTELRNLLRALQLPKHQLETWPVFTLGHGRRVNGICRRCGRSIAKAVGVCRPQEERR